MHCKCLRMHEEVLANIENVRCEYLRILDDILAAASQMFVNSERNPCGYDSKKGI